jgi:hypothetical protein
MKTNALYLITFLIALFSLHPITSLSQEKYIVKSIKIDYDELDAICNEIHLENVKQNEFPVINQIAAEEFINGIFSLENPRFKDDDPINIYWKDKNFNKRPTILVMHPINIQALKGDDKMIKSANNAYEYACKKSKTLKVLIDSLSKERDKKILSTVDKPCDGLKTDVKAVDIAKTIAEINQSINLLQTELAMIDTELISANADVIKCRRKISENTDKTLTYILNKEDNEWNDYLLNKSQILFVIVGGKNDLSNATFMIDNLPSSFQTSFNEFQDLATQLGVLGKAMGEGDCCKVQVIKDSISVKFVLVNKNEIKAPSIITVTEEKSKINLKFENHEKSWFGLKVGVSASKFDRKIFSIDSLNNLTIKPDSIQKNDWKGNLMVMLDWYPFGRDIDRLDFILGKNKNIDFFDPNRLSVTAGLKLSKDPLESCFLGLSYALTKEFSITGGFAFNATPKDVKDLPVGVNATFDYLQSNAERKLEPSWFFGITLSPGRMSKALGYKQ